MKMKYFVLGATTAFLFAGCAPQADTAAAPAEEEAIMEDTMPPVENSPPSMLAEEVSEEEGPDNQ